MSNTRIPRYSARSDTQELQLSDRDAVVAAVRSFLKSGTRHIFARHPRDNTSPQNPYFTALWDGTERDFMIEWVTIYMPDYMEAEVTTCDRDNQGLKERGTIQVILVHPGEFIADVADTDDDPVPFHEDDSHE